MNKSQIAETLSKLQLDDRENLIMNSTVTDTAEKILNTVEGKTTKLKVNKIWVDTKLSNKDVKLQKEYINTQKVWGDDLRADVSLIDKETGKTIDRARKIKLATIPKLTDRYTYSIKGNEYSFAKQSRLKPGVYTKRKSNGEIGSFINVDKTVDMDRGFNNNVKIDFAPEKKTFTMQYGQKNISLINALRILGSSEKDIEDKLGRDAYLANDKINTKKYKADRTKFYSAMFGHEPGKDEDPKEIEKSIKERFEDTGMSEETTKVTLGKAYKNLNSDILLDASKKILDINKGIVKGDDRESLIFKDFYSAEDHVREKLTKAAKKIKSNMAFKLDRTKQINKSISSSNFDPYTIGAITTSKLSAPSSQINIMNMIGEATKVTAVGEGGIGSSNAITNEMRALSNSELGFIDPLQSPEGGAIGITGHVALDTIKLGKELYTKVLNKKGEEEALTPIQLYDKKVAFPKQGKSGKIKVVHKGEMLEVDAKDVDYRIPNAKGMFSASANSIPFLDSLQGNRGLTASKMQEQALALVDKNKPLFLVTDNNGKSVTEKLAGSIALPKATVSGEVVSVSPDEIKVKGEDGKIHTHGLYNNMSLNSEGFIHNNAIVSKGDKVKTGQLLADNNNTVDGQIALGANLRVAYMPYKGYNFEDSAIMSESAAKKLTSSHIYNFKAKRSSKGVFSKNKLKAYYPEGIDKKNMDKLDDDGVIKVGQEVDHDDVLVAHMESKPPTADDIAVGRLDKQMRRDMSDSSQRWHKDNKGIVTSVKKSGNSVVVNVKTIEKFKEADKIAGLHGNKHIISKIIPDSEMPFDPVTGKHIELTMSPIGVSNRINTSQLLENAAGKIAEKTGKQYVVENFSNQDNARKVMNDLKASGLSDKDWLVDPATGKKFRNKIANGISHIMKLEHTVDHKFASRYTAGYDANEQPTTGGHDGAKKMGRMEISAILARDGHETLKEMFDVKGQRNDEYWRAIELGQTPPPPKTNFVWDKQIAMMKGAGINVEQTGKSFKLKPMTDSDILKLSKGELKDPDKTYRKKDLAPIKDGLFDPHLAGGMHGDSFTHFKLPEKTLNPITEAATAAITNMTKTDVTAVLDGKKFVDTKTGELVKPGTKGSISGGPGIEILLKRVNINEDLKNAEEAAALSKNRSQLNKLNRKINTLKALKKNNMKPTDYLVENMLVTPSKVRPMFSMGNEGTVIMSDANNLYQTLAKSSTAMKDLAVSLDGVPHDYGNVLLADARSAIYNDVKAITGLGDPTSYLDKVQGKKGYISIMDGGKDKQTKTGFFQSKVVERRQDMTGRSTISLDPNLGGDEIGIPEDMMTDLFRPKIMAKIIGQGYSALEAQKQIKDQTEVFKKARQIVADENLVIANRAPSLHRWNMTAFHPKLIKGKSINVGPNVIGGNFGGDYDGDSIIGTTKLLVTKAFTDYYKESGKNIDFGKINTYIGSVDSFLNERRITMPTLNNLPVLIENGDSVIHINMEDIPRIESSKVINEKNGNEDYDVPDGMFVLTLDNETHEFVKAPIIKFSIHKDLVSYTVETNQKDTLILSSDESAIAIDKETWELKRVKPESLNGGAMMAKVLNVDVEHSLNTARLNNRDLDFDLNRDSGWFFGIMIGDGSTSIVGTKYISLSTVHDEISLKYDNVSNTISGENVSVRSYANDHKFNGHDCHSIVHHKTMPDFALDVRENIGTSSIDKHLPPFFLSSSLEFKKGLLSGLIDSDGSCQYTKSTGKAKRQFSLMYSTISIRLAEEVKTLCSSLGLRASVKANNYSQGRDGILYNIIISVVSAHGFDLSLSNPDKKAAWEEYCSTEIDKESTVVLRQDLVPFSAGLAIDIKPMLHYKNTKSEYNAVSDSKKSGFNYMTRYNAKKLIALDTNNVLDRRWVEIVNNTDVTWVYAKSVELNPKRIDMYDVTAPGPYTFMVANGIIVQDTFQIHAPHSLKAQKEAMNMLPSSSMIKTGWDQVLNLPGQDIVTGAWLAANGKGGLDTGKTYKTLEDMEKSVANGEISYLDKVTLNKRKSTAGLHAMNSKATKGIERWDTSLTSKELEGWIKDIVKKDSGKAGLDLIDKIKDVGNSAVTDFGFTLGVSDTLTDNDIKKPLLDKAKKMSEGKSASEKVDIYHAATMAAQKAFTKKHADKDMFGIGITSGGSKGVGNTGAITLMPGIVTDADDIPIDIPITNSYSEGLTPFDYWAAGHGARGGNIKKSVQSFKPGWFTKDIMNSIYDTRITSEDPMDTVGVKESTKNSKNIINRFLAQDAVDGKGKIIAKRNTLVDSDAVNKFNKFGVDSVHVQSPLTDPTPGDGFSSFSYGVNYDGSTVKTGDHIGIKASHTITEPSLNLAMKAFHTGGALQKGGKNMGTAFDAMFRAFRFDKSAPDKAPLAPEDDVVADIGKSSVGGWAIKMGNGEEIYADSDRELKVKKGDKVKKGQFLTNGTADPHEMLKYNGMEATQKYLTDVIDNINDNRLDRREIETVVRGITNTTRVMNPGSNTQYTSGDVAPLTTINWLNNHRNKEVDLSDASGYKLDADYGSMKKGYRLQDSDLSKFGKKVSSVKVKADKISHEPFLTPTGIAAKASSSKDWITRLASNRVRAALEDGATQSWESFAGSGKDNPLKDYVTGIHAK